MPVPSINLPPSLAIKSSQRTATPPFLSARCPAKALMSSVRMPSLSWLLRHCFPQAQKINRSNMKPMLCKDYLKHLEKYRIGWLTPENRPETFPATIFAAQPNYGRPGRCRWPSCTLIALIPLSISEPQHALCNACSQSSSDFLRYW